MKKVLIISYYFPPVNIVASRRYGDMAPYMETFGWKPIMLTTHSVGDLPVRLSEKSIIRVGENCDSGKTVLAAEGYRGIPFFAKPFYFFYRACRMDITSMDRFIFSWKREVLQKRGALRALKPDLILATYQPAVSLWLGNDISKELLLPWIADLRDAVSLYNTSRLAIVRWIDSLIDKSIMRSASRIITISPQLAKLMSDFYQKPVDVVYNGFDIDGKTFWTKPPKKKNNFILYYAGRFHPHRIPAAKLVIDWLAKRTVPHAIFRVRSLGPREANEEIFDYARKKGISKALELLPSAPPDIIFQEEEEADILLICEDISKMNPISNTNMTGKLFEYLPFRAPIVAITRQDSDIRLVINDTGRGFLASSLRELGRFLEKVRRGNPPRRNDNRIANYSRKSQCQKLCRIMDEVLEKKTP